MKTKTSSPSHKFRAVKGEARDRFLRALCPLAIAAIASGFPGAPLRAAELVVGPGDYATIQAALDDASEGDTILLKDDEPYKGAGNTNLVLDGAKNVTIRSENGAESTIIDMESAGRAFTFQNGSTSTLNGLQFINGETLYAGALLITDSPSNSPVITDCIFRNNRGAWRGGAIQADVNEASSLPVITRCVFSGNASDAGGAVYAGTATGFLKIEDCVFTDNIARFEGGAIFCRARTVVRDSTFSRNRVGLKGGAIRALNGSSIVRCSFFMNETASAIGTGGAVSSEDCLIGNSLFSKNRAVKGGAVATVGAAEAHIFHCTFSGNECDSEGAAVFCQQDTTIFNSILWGNKLSSRHPDPARRDSSNQIAVQDARLQLENSDVEGYLDGITKLGSATVYTRAIIDLDPKFALEEDLHLMPDSPCIDAGVNGMIPGFTFSAINQQGYAEYEHIQTGILFVLLPGGTFSMGAQATDSGQPNYDPSAESDESPVHDVTLSPFLIAKYEVTQAEYENVMGSNPSPALGNLAAAFGAASQSTTDDGADADRAIDGNTDGVSTNGSVSHTQQENKPWWEVDLGASFPLESIVLWNRTDCCQDGLSNFRVSVLDGDEEVYGADFFTDGTNPGVSFTIPLPAYTLGQTVRVQLKDTGGTRQLSLAEVQVFASNAGFPVGDVSWNDLRFTNGFLHLTGLFLPTEAQWEYACRAGTSGPYAGTGSLDDMGWHSMPGGMTRPVGMKNPNAFGLYDTHGNAWEWCEDWYQSDFYNESQATDPLCYNSSSGLRVIRGGSYWYGPSEARSANRNDPPPDWSAPETGFRPVYHLNDQSAYHLLKQENTYDLDGQARRADAPPPDTGRGTSPIADMGAYEFDPALSLLAVSPPRLTLVAKVGGPPPDGQTVSIRNRGLGALDWGIREDIPWLRVEVPESPSADGTQALRVYVDDSDDSASARGVYTGQVQLVDSTGLQVLGTVELTFRVTGELNVPGEYPSINRAIAAANEGDVVLVESGTYAGGGNWGIQFPRSITLKSRQGPEDTIIDLTGWPKWGFFIRRPLRSVIIEGFTIKNGDFNSPVELRNGAAFHITGWACVTILDCIISDNHADGTGGGLYARDFGSIRIARCSFLGNDAASGGAVAIGDPASPEYADGSGDVLIEECRFSGNSCTSPGGVGGALAHGDDAGRLTIVNSTFENNASSHQGGGVRSAGVFSISSCIFLGNTSVENGGGLYSTTSSDECRVYNCVFAENAAGYYGGGVYCNSKLELTNCTFHANTCGSRGGGIYYGFVTVTNSILWQNKSNGTVEDIYGSGGADISYTDETSEGDPLFVDAAAGDLRLRPESPCIDTGKRIPWLFSDLRGSLRPVDIDGMPRGGTEQHSPFDKGAYEFSGDYGGLPGDETTRAFKNVEIGGPMAVTGFEYEIHWSDKDPFPFDTRIRHAGEYQVNLSLVNDQGLTVELGTYTVEVTQHGYSIRFTFGAEHIGDWRIRVELASDPNQYALSEEISIEYKEATRYALGQWIQPPPDADPAVKPEVDFEDACYWSVETNRLYGIAPVTTVVTWYEDEERERPLPVVAYITYPDPDRDLDPDIQIHIADSMPVDLLPAGTRFDLAERMYASNDATLSANKFTASREGWAVLLYQDQQGETDDEKEKFDVVRTYVWDHAMDPGRPAHAILNPQFPLESSCDIGTAITDPEHCPECENGYVFFEGARHDGYGEAKAYDRETRHGPIFAVNEDDPATEQDDLVVVWYKRSAYSGVCWPSKPVRYDAQWPTDPPRIVIASGIGSGPLSPDKYGPIESMLIYSQPDKAQPGYNGNEEHTAFFKRPEAPFAAVFPLRTDLNRPADNASAYQAGDRSRPYTLLKYRDPGTAEWKFEVFEVVAQAGSYMVQGGQVVPDDGSDRRYYIAQDGSLLQRSGALPSESYYIDAEGHLANPAASVEVCYNYSEGSVVVAEACDVHYVDGSGQLQATPDDSAPPGSYALDVHGVLVESDVYYRFHYAGVAGEEIIPPFPLNLPSFGPCAASYTTTEATILEDKGGKFHAKHGGLHGEPTADGILKLFYRLQPGFFYDLDEDGVPDEVVGSCIPWRGVIDGETEGPPADTVYAIRWPEVVPTLLVGETLTYAKTQEGERVGLPRVADQCIVDLLFDQSLAEGGGPSAKLIDPLREHAVKFQDVLPFQLLPERALNNRWVFKALPYYLQARLTYDELTEELKLKGYFERGTVESMLLLNTLTERDIMEISRVFMSQPELVVPENWSRPLAPIPEPFKTALYDLRSAGDAGLVGAATLKDAEMKAVTAGDAQGAPSYVTLAFNDDPDCPGLVSLSVIKVDCPLYRGQIRVIESDDAFEEKVTLRHNGDFGGNSDARWFQWKYLPGDFSGIPTGPGAAGETWQNYSDYVPGYSTVLQAPGTQPEIKDGGLFHQGAVDVTIGGTGAELLPDRWFSVRYFYGEVCDPDISAWTKPQLYEGWVKRVMKKVNLFDQKVRDFHSSEVNTLASMISLAGRRYEGAVELSSDPENLRQLGIIEAYQTLLNRAKEMTIEQGVDSQDTNKAILFAANRLAGLYVLLANEAYADATDPTIGFSTADGQYGSEAPSIFCFQNQVDSLLEEELVLLRGRDDVGERPFYNRFVWNFTLGDGEVAYKENYNITDQETDQTGDGVPDAPDGIIDERDAMVLYPQGHGDAWGHYLTAVKYYYDLLRHPDFTWIPQSEAILVGQTPVEVDYRDERSFASAAAAKARTGAEIVGLTYRQHYVEDPEGQWQGYKDPDPARAWGVDGWSRRAGQGALFDWVVGNALLEPEDTVHEGVAKVDRTTVVELREVASSYAAVQAEVDRSSVGLNPLGIAKEAVPFDIDPGAITNGQTHFEQIYDRAVQAMNNAIAVFNHANQSTMLLRRQQDTLTNFKRNIENTEVDYNNRLVEVFGYPYEDDCGPGRTYTREYGQTGPDLYHYMYVDPSELMGVEAPEVHEFPVTLQTIEVDAKGVLQVYEKEVLFHVATDSRFGLIKPPEWRGRRKAPGEIQLARSDVLQARGRFEKALVEYENLLGHIEKQADLIEAQHQLNADEIWILNRSKNKQQSLNAAIRDSRFRQLLYRTIGSSAVFLSNAVAEALPTNTGVIAGMAGGVIADWTSAIRSAIRVAGQAVERIMSGMADFESLAELDQQQAKEIESAEMNIELTALRGGFAVEQQLLQLENLIRTEATLRLEIYTLAESLQQSAGRYLAALARGERLLQDRLRFRRQTAAQIQDYRYKDMTFRIFRNDALQKYRAQFDMAASYVYLAAKAYDYETTLLDHDTMAGEAFLTDIVRQRTIGMIEGGQPLTGTGLADPMKRMWQNFQVLKPQLGFNNPQQETNRFSLRRELFRITMDEGSNATWRQVLDEHRVDNLWDVPEFRRYCRPFADEGVPQPAIVIRFSTTITAGLNLFEWPLGGRDSYYSATNFATKVRSVGVWFSNYNAVQLAETPRIYLVPVGQDVLRTPSRSTKDIRTWQVVDQKLPVPFPIVQSELENNPGWIPMVDTTFDEMFQIRRHSDFRAYHDSGFVNESEMTFDSRLVGRSVWNTGWLLVIPGQSLLHDPDEGLDRFIHGPEVIGGTGERDGNGVWDIKLFFHTYAYSGN